MGRGRMVKTLPFHWFSLIDCIHAGWRLVTLMVVSQQNMTTCRSSLIEEHEVFDPVVVFLNVLFVCRCSFVVAYVMWLIYVSVVAYVTCLRYLSGDCTVSRWSVRCCTELDRRKCSLCTVVKWGPSCGPCELSSSVQLCTEPSGLLM